MEDWVEGGRRVEAPGSTYRIDLQEHDLGAELAALEDLRAVQHQGLTPCSKGKQEEEADMGDQESGRQCVVIVMDDQREGGACGEGGYCGRVGLTASRP